MRVQDEVRRQRVEEQAISIHCRYRKIELIAGATTVASHIARALKYVSCLISRRKRLSQVWRIRYQVLVSTTSVIANAQTSSDAGYKQENKPFPVDYVLSSDHA
jgi:hypothetical protein